MRDKEKTQEDGIREREGGKRIMEDSAGSLGNSSGCRGGGPAKNKLIGSEGRKQKPKEDGKVLGKAKSEQGSPASVGPVKTSRQQVSKSWEAAHGTRGAVGRSCWSTEF